MGQAQNFKFVGERADDLHGELILTITTNDVKLAGEVRESQPRFPSSMGLLQLA
jgi:hypothetical protein